MKPLQNSFHGNYKEIAAHAAATDQVKHVCNCIYLQTRENVSGLTLSCDTDESALALFSWLMALFSARQAWWNSFFAFISLWYFFAHGF